MGKVLKWFFGIIVMLIVIFLILMFCGVIKFRYSSPIPGTSAYLTVYDYNDHVLTAYMDKIGCQFQGITIDFDGAFKSNETTKELKEQQKEDREEEEDDLWDDDDEDEDEDE